MRIPDKILAEELTKLREAFAERPDSFFRVLANEIIECEFSEARVKQGIKDTIRTCGYHNLSISEVIKSIQNSRIADLPKNNAGFRDFRNIDKPQ